MIAMHCCVRGTEAVPVSFSNFVLHHRHLLSWVDADIPLRFVGRCSAAPIQRFPRLLTSVMNRLQPANSLTWNETVTVARRNIRRRFVQKRKVNAIARVPGAHHAEHQAAVPSTYSTRPIAAPLGF